MNNKTTRMWHKMLILGSVSWLIAFIGPGAAQDFALGSEGALEELNEHFALAVYPFARRGAQPLGVLGLEVYAELAADQDLDGQPYGSLVDSLPGGLLLPVRVGVRKGLPGGFDVGASFVQVLDLDFSAFSLDLQKALFKPGALKPGLALRLAYSDGDSGSVYSLEQYGAELIASKGFTLVSVFGGAGLVRSEGSFGFGGAGPGSEVSLTTSSTNTVLFAGVRINLLLPKITFAVEKTKEFQGVVRIAFGW